MVRLDVQPIELYSKVRPPVVKMVYGNDMAQRSSEVSVSVSVS
jgi:hypothetical protein